MLWARSVMDDWIGENGGEPHLKTLTAYFVALYFIMATQVCTELPEYFDPFYWGRFAHISKCLIHERRSCSWGAAVGQGDGEIPWDL